MRLVYALMKQPVATLWQHLSTFQGRIQYELIYSLRGANVRTIPIGKNDVKIAVLVTGYELGKNLQLDFHVVQQFA